MATRLIVHQIFGHDSTQRMETQTQVDGASRFEVLECGVLLVYNAVDRYPWASYASGHWTRAEWVIEGS